MEVIIIAHIKDTARLQYDNGQISAADFSMYHKSIIKIITN